MRRTTDNAETIKLFPPVSPPPPSLGVACSHEIRNDIEHSDQDIAGYGKVRERGMEWLSRPAPEPVELTTSEGYRRPDRKPTSHIYVLLALLTRQLLNWTPL